MSCSIHSNKDLEKIFNVNDRDLDKVVYALGITSDSEDEFCDSSDYEGK